MVGGNTGVEMANTLTSKGQVTIPKRIRSALGLQPGDGVDFFMNERGQVVVKRAAPSAAEAEGRQPDALDRARGAADYRWPSTDEYMRFVRGDDYGKE